MRGLEQLLKPGRSDELIDRMAPMPRGYTHLGIANVRMPDGTKQLTVTVAGPGLQPLIFEPRQREWRTLQTGAAI